MARRVDGEIETATRRLESPSRRTLLAGLLGGVAAWAAGAIGRVAPAAAANGDVVHVGDQNLVGTQTTILSSATQSISVLWGNSTAAGGTGVGVRGDAASQGGSGVWGTGPGVGVRGTSSFGTGVSGSSTSSIGVRGSSGSVSAVVAKAGLVGDSDTGIGVWGISQSGLAVYGISSESTGVTGESLATNGVGVRGVAQAGRGVMGLSTTGRGVHGESDSAIGVYGRSDTGYGVFGVGPGASAIGVYAESSAGVALSAKTITGYALNTSGRLKADKVSGIASIPAGKTSVTVTPGVAVTSGSFVLLTPTSNLGSRGLWFTTSPTAGTFTIRMSSSRTSTTRIAWLLLG